MSDYITTYTGNHVEPKKPVPELSRQVILSLFDFFSGQRPGGSEGVL